jgi:hypothetical protein
MVRHEKKEKILRRHSEKLPESQYELLLACAHLAYSFVSRMIDRPRFTGATITALPSVAKNVLCNGR